MTMKNVILIGDSIRMGYQSFVKAECATSAQIWAPEENGGNSRNVLEHLDEWVLSRRPDLVHVNCGLHDIRREFGAGPVVPLAEYRANVETILRRILEVTDAHGASSRLIWATMTPVDQQRHHETKGFDRFSADVLSYNRAAVAVCQELEVPVDDLFVVVTKAGPSRLLLPDGVHFSEEGYRILGRAVADVLRKSL